MRWMLRRFLSTLLLSFLLCCSLSAQSQQSDLVFKIDTLEQYLNSIEENSIQQQQLILNLESNLQQAEESLKIAEEQQQNLENQLAEISQQQETLLNSLEKSEKKLFYWKVGSIVVTTTLATTVVILLVMR